MARRTIERLKGRDVTGQFSLGLCCLIMLLLLAVGSLPFMLRHLVLGSLTLLIAWQVGSTIYWSRYPDELVGSRWKFLIIWCMLIGPGLIAGLLAVMGMNFTLSPLLIGVAVFVQIFWTPAYFFYASYDWLKKRHRLNDAVLPPRVENDDILDDFSKLE